MGLTDKLARASWARSNHLLLLPATVDGRNPAPHKKPWNSKIPTNYAVSWLQSAAKWISSTHSMASEIHPRVKFKILGSGGALQLEARPNLNRTSMCKTFLLPGAQWLTRLSSRPSSEMSSATVVSCSPFRPRNHGLTALSQAYPPKIPCSFCATSN